MAAHIHDLADLLHHWGSAYVITHPDADVWCAERRDNHETLRTQTPDALLAKIRADYLAKPVPRTEGNPS